MTITRLSYYDIEYKLHGHTDTYDNSDLGRMFIVETVFDIM